MAKKNDKAVAFSELLIIGITSILVIAGVSMSLFNSMALDDYNKEFSVAMNIVKAKLEKTLARRADFFNITSDMTGKLTLATDGIKGAYRIDIADVIPDELKTITVSVCWQGRNSRIVGSCHEDSDGILQWNAQALVNEPCSISAAIAR